MISSLKASIFPLRSSLNDTRVSGSMPRYRIAIVSMLVLDIAAANSAISLGVRPHSPPVAILEIFKYVPVKFTDMVYDKVDKILTQVKTHSNHLQADGLSF